MRCGTCDKCADRRYNELLTEMTQQTWTLGTLHLCNARHPCNTIRAINFELYACQNNCQIQVFRHDLTPARTLSDRRWGDVNDVTQLHDKRLAVASSRGLFLLSAAGQTVAVLEQDDFYGSCVVVNDRLFASCDNREQLNEYRLVDGEWTKANEIARRLARRSRVSMAVSDTDTIFYGLENPDSICEISTAGDDIAPVDLTEANGGDYRLCAADRYGAILVADKREHRLQVRDRRHGAWNVLDLRPSPRNPQSAVVISSTLCVSHDGGLRISLYTKDCGTAL